MRYYRQLEYNDCFRTCIGCLLHLPPQYLPHFVDIFEDQYFTSARHYILRRFKLDLSYKPNTPQHRPLPSQAPTGKAIGIVRITKGKGKNLLHAVITNNGSIIHDPGIPQGKAKLKRRIKSYKIIGWITLCVPIS